MFITTTRMYQPPNLYNILYEINRYQKINKIMKELFMYY